MSDKPALRMTGQNASSQTVTLPEGYSEPFAVRTSSVYCCVVITGRNGKPSRCSNERKFCGRHNMALCCRVHVSRENAARTWMAAEGIDV
jgi:hypothetical protein